MARRSKRKSTVATRFSARKQARQQGDAEIYGSDYGILPSGGFGCSFVLALLVFSSVGCLVLPCKVISLLSQMLQLHLECNFSLTHGIYGIVVSNFMFSLLPFMFFLFLAD